MNNKKKNLGNFMDSEIKKNIKNDSEKEIMDLKILFKIAKSTCKWFISVFIIVFTVGMMANFFVFPNLRYYSKSHIIVSFKNILFQEKISNGFPGEEVNMWLIKSQQYWVQYTNNWDTAATEILQSDEFLNKLSKSLNNRFSVGDLSKRIKFDRVIEVNSLNITVSSNNREDAYKINETLLKIFTEDKKVEFEKAYSNFLAGLDKKILENQKKLSDIKDETEIEIVNYYKNNLNGSENLNNANIQDNLVLSSNLIEQINNLENEYKLLIEARENVKENKDYFVNRIFYILEPQVYSNLDFLRNIILSIFAGLILAISTSLIVNIYNQKRGKVNF
jgi:capsular polysaccharide biosynthesis protein